jgi:hypothetical protein
MNKNSPAKGVRCTAEKITALWRTRVIFIKGFIEAERSAKLSINFCRSFNAPYSLRRTDEPILKIEASTSA